MVTRFHASKSLSSPSLLAQKGPTLQNQGSSSPSAPPPVEVAVLSIVINQIKWQQGTLPPAKCAMIS